MRKRWGLAGLLALAALGVNAIPASAALGVQIGDLVWNDADGDGVQDSGEPGISGATVTLECEGGEPRTTWTDTAGRYLFDSVPAATACTMHFAAEGELAPTKTEAGGDARFDSDIDPSGTAALTTGAPGENDRTIDAGYVAHVTEPDLGLTISSGTDCACGEVPFEVIVANHGTADAEPFSVQVPLAAGVTLRPSTGWSDGYGMAVAEVGIALKPGEAVKLPLLLDVPCAELAVTAKIAGFTDAAPADNSAIATLEACRPSIPEPQATAY